MSQPTNISIDKLIPNVDNSRFLEEQNSIDEAIGKLLDLYLEKIVTLAIDIAEYKMDPSENLIITPHPEQEDTYIVLEGNRRLCALWILLDPELVGDRLDDSPRKTQSLYQAHETYVSSGGIEEVSVAIIEDHAVAARWIKLKHTGENNGAGRVPWEAQAIRRHNEKFDGVTDPAMKLLYSIVEAGLITDRQRMDIPVTTFDRVIRTGGLSSALGYKISKGQLYFNSLYDDLSLHFLANITFKLISDSEGWDSRTLDTAVDRKEKIRELAEEMQNQDPTISLDRFNSFFEISKEPEQQATGSGQEAVPQPEQMPTAQEEISRSADDDPTGSNEAPSSSTGNQVADDREETPTSNDQSSIGKRTRQVASTMERDKLMPETYRLRITEPRINDIYHELKNLRVSENPNAISVLWRLFLEFSANYYLLEAKIITMEELSENKSNPKLDSKIKTIAKYLQSDKGWSEAQINPFIQEVNDPESMYCVANFHMLVHNHLQTPTEYFLKSTWNNFEPLITEIWN